MSKPLIVVVGATGRQGGSVVRVLNKSGKWRLRGLTRNVHSKAAEQLTQQGIEMVQCNINDKEQLLDAFKVHASPLLVKKQWE